MITGTEPLNKPGILLVRARTDTPGPGCTGGGGVVVCGGRDHTTVRVEVDDLDTGDLRQLTGRVGMLRAECGIPNDESPGIPGLSGLCGVSGVWGVLLVLVIR